MLRSRSLKQTDYWVPSSGDLPYSRVTSPFEEPSTPPTPTRFAIRHGQSYTTRRQWRMSGTCIYTILLVALLSAFFVLDIVFYESHFTTRLNYAKTFYWNHNNSSNHTASHTGSPPILELKKQNRKKGGASRPIVDRDKVLDLGEDEPEHDHTTPRHDIVNLRWPPLVTSIPEIVPSAEALKSGITTSLVDAQFCNGEPCRFLFPLWIGEQESKGRLHLMQVAHLAATLNRTLVLPNVSKSRIGGCGKWTFDAYYDIAGFARQVHELYGMSRRIVSMDDFKTWVDIRPEGPVAQLVLFDEQTPTFVHDPLQSTLLATEGAVTAYVDTTPLNLDDARLKNAHCLHKKFKKMSLEARYPVSIKLATVDPHVVVPTGPEWAAILQRDDVAHAAIRRPPEDVPVLQDILVQGDSPPLQLSEAQDADVLLVHWDLRHLPAMSSAAFRSLQYSSSIRKLAKKLTSPYKPYVAVHWRMETVLPALLPDCAEALVDTLSGLLADPTFGEGVRSVWLATDLPWSGSDADGLHGQKAPLQRSNTFRNVSREHAEALGILSAAFEPNGNLEGWRLTGLAQEIERVREEIKRSGEDFMLDDDDEAGHLWKDSGVWGILDKMAAMESALFVSASKGCGRVSSFTKQIVDYRIEGRGEHAPRNVVELFG